MSVRPIPFGLLLLFFTLMVALGAMPGQAEQLSAGIGDKSLHVLAYALLTLLCFAALSAPPLHRAAITLAAVALLGLTDEAIQALLPYRNASLADWCFDVGTATLVSLLLVRVSYSTESDTHAQKSQ